MWRSSSHKESCFSIPAPLPSKDLADKQMNPEPQNSWRKKWFQSPLFIQPADKWAVSTKSFLNCIFMSKNKWHTSSCGVLECSVAQWCLVEHKMIKWSIQGKFTQIYFLMIFFLATNHRTRILIRECVMLSKTFDVNIMFFFHRLLQIIHFNCQELSHDFYILNYQKATFLQQITASLLLNTLPQPTLLKLMILRN